MKFQPDAEHSYRVTINDPVTHQPRTAYLNKEEKEKLLDSVMAPPVSCGLVISKDTPKPRS